MAISNIDEIREFVVAVRKSGITNDQCVEGFRILQILKRLGINDNDNDYDYENGRDLVYHGNFDSDYNSLNDNSDKEKKPTDKKTTFQRKKDLYYFVENIYKRCIELGINSSNMTEWIKDLLDCQTYLDNQYSKVIDNSNNNNNSSNFSSFTDENSKLHSSSQTMNDEHITPIQKDNVPTASNRKMIIDIPFVSQISNYLNQKKEECKNLDNYRKSIYQNIKTTKEQKKVILQNLNATIQKKNRINRYYSWFENLQIELKDRFNIKIEDEIFDFVNIINDFKNYGYNIHRIISEFDYIGTLQQKRNPERYRNQWKDQNRSNK